MPGEVVAPTRAVAREVMQRGAASSERVGDETGGSDIGFLPLDLLSWTGLGWAGFDQAGLGCLLLPKGGGGGPPCAPPEPEISPSWERLMVAVGKAAPIQQFICL